jgi:hypothetical protein
MVELGGRVVALAAARAVMEANEPPPRRRIVRLEAALRMIADGERD